MAAGTSPIFVATPRASFVATGINGNASLDGSGTVATLFTAGANGSKVEDVYFEHLGSNIATVLRVFINNGSANSTPANNSLVYETTMAANTISQTAASVPQLWRANLVLPTGYKLNVTIGTTVGAGIQCTAIGGDY